MARDQETARRSRPARQRAGLGCTLLAFAVVTACGSAQAPDRVAASPPAPAAAEHSPGATATPATTPPASPVPATPTPPSQGRAGPSGAGGRTVCVERAGCFGQPERAGVFDVAAVPEASGLVASQRNPGILWLLDDRPGTGEVWAMRTTGQLLGPVTVAGLDGRDTEALAVGPCDVAEAAPAEAASCVYVGDIGDNRRSRDHVAVHRFEEPDLSGGVPPEPVAAEVARLTYPTDGTPAGVPAHDAEALLVDPRGALLVVTKAPFDAGTGETGETRLYVAERFGDGVLADHGPVGLPRPALPLHSRLVGNVVTGADARDGFVLLRTYDQVLLHVAPDATAPVTTFPSWPVHELPSALEPQSEAIAWARDGCGYYTVGEQAGDLWFVPCRP